MNAPTMPKDQNEDNNRMKSPTMPKAPNEASAANDSIKSPSEWNNSIKSPSAADQSAASAANDIMKSHSAAKEADQSAAKAAAKRENGVSSEEGISVKSTPLPTLSEIRKRRGKRVLCYGDAGVGKSTLFTKLACKTLYIDLEYTLDDLFDEIPNHIVPFCPSSWDELQKALASEKVEKYGAVVIDSLTTLESMWLTYALTHCRKAPEGYGAVVWSEKELPALKDEREFGGGGVDSAKFAMWTRFENLMTGVINRGVNVIDLCHVVDERKDDASEGMNVVHAPRLLNPNNTTGKNSIRKRAVEWHGEVWYMKWETVRKDDEHLARTGKRIILGQPCEEFATDFDGTECKSRRGFSKAYLEDFDVNEVLGIK